MAKPILIGEDNFKTMISQGFYYIDKTAYIKEIIDNFGGAKQFLRPRRFGKTTNMSMLREYFDITKKEENKDLFKGLYIDTLEEYKKYQGGYPVIFMTLKKAKQDTWEEMYAELKRIVINVYKEHEYVKESLKEYELIEYNNILNNIGSESEYRNALQSMSEYLYRYYNQKVIILIDEYDAPLNQAYTKGFGDKAISFIRSFLGAALKTNEYLQVGVLTGVLQIGQQSIFSDLNNLKVYSITSNQAEEYFGFTKEEVKQMLVDYDLEEKLEEIVKWYDGYNFNEIEIFNPWSILNCVKKKGQLDKYWVNTGNTNLVDIASEGVNTEIVEAIGKLLNGETVEVEIQPKTVYEKLQGNVESFLNTLLYTGYLTLQKEYRNENNRRIAVLKIPNEEIKQVIADMQYKWFPKFEDSDLVLGLCKSIVEQDDEEFIINLNRLITEETSYFNSSEDYYNGLFTTAMLRMPREYIRQREYETGYGRIDYMMYKEDKSIGMIFEFKVCKSEEELDSKVEEGMKQIYDLKYYTQLEKQGVKEIKLYSIAFSKKRARVRKEEYVAR